MDGKQFRFGCNYVLFSDHPSQTVVLTTPPTVAHAQPRHAEVWCDNRLSREIFKRAAPRGPMYPNEALAYSYDLLLRHFNHPEAHRAYMFNLYPIEPPPVIRESTEVGAGSAVCYVEDNETQENWAVVEEADGPDPTRLEYGPDHPLTRAFLGKESRRSPRPPLWYQLCKASRR
jgi:hypothetical protein